MIHQRQLFWGLLLVAFLALIAVVAIYIKPSSLPNQEALPVSNGGTPLESSSEKVTSVTDQSTYRPPNRNKVTIKSPSRRVTPSIPDSKLERIADFYASLNSVGYVYPYEGPHPKEIEILTEGMDTLSAAQYLRALAHFDYALEYAERALAENPASFEALLLRTQLLPSDREDEREAGFRQLVERDGHSVEALVGLAWVISDRNPSEAIEYVQRAIKIDPSNAGAYRALGSNYERLGRYDEALAAHKKAFQIDPGQVSAVHIRAIEEGNPIIKPITQKSESQLPEEGLSQGASSQAPQEALVSPIPDSSEGVESETTFDSEPLIEPPENERRALSPQAQQAMEAEFEKLMKEYEQMIRGESAPTDAIERQIADFRRSISEHPNQKESYLELGQAYEKAGEHKKAAEIYRQARKRFPKDERVKRKSESFRKRRSQAQSEQRANERDGEKQQRSGDEKDAPPEAKR